MAFSYEASHGTTFLYNKKLAGNVTIIRGTEQLTVPASDLVEFLENGAREGWGGKPPPHLARKPETNAPD